MVISEWCSYFFLHLLIASCCHQRACMGLLEYQRPCLSGVTWLITGGYVHLLYNSSWKFHQLAARLLMSGQQVRYGKGRGYGTSITYKSCCPVTLLPKARRAAVLGQPSGFRSHWLSLPHMPAPSPPLLFDRHLLYSAHPFLSDINYYNF
jgi:hypothetical protein